MTEREPSDWRIEVIRSRTQATLYTVLKRDPEHHGCGREGYRAIKSKTSLKKAFRFIEKALSEVSG